MKKKLKKRNKTRFNTLMIKRLMKEKKNNKKSKNNKQKKSQKWKEK